MREKHRRYEEKRQVFLEMMAHMHPYFFLLIIIIINVEFYSHVLMIAGFQQEQPLAAIFLIRNRGAAVLYS